MPNNQYQTFRFFVSFGQRSPFRQGYVEVIAKGKDENQAIVRARNAVFQALGDQWSMLYDEPTIIKHKNHFPAGKIGETIHV